MADPGKKAELDAEGIDIPQKKQEPGNSESNKAELDSDGLSTQVDGKAELDKEGMSFFKKIQQTITHSTDSSKTEGQDGQDVEKSKFSLPPWFKLAAIGFSAVLVLMLGGGGLFWYLSKSPEPEKTVQEEAPAVQTVAEKKDEGEIVLDPFMIMYEPRKEKQTGILIAQLSLRVNPKIAPNVKNKLYEIRSILQEDLTKNALVYTQFELVEMMKEHLRLYDVADITFVKYDLS